MKFYSVLLSVLLASPAALGAPSGSNYAIFEKLAQTPEGYSEINTPVDLSSSILLRFHIKQRNMKLLQQRLLQVSDPDHETYGQHMSKDQVNSMIKPSDSAVKTVTSWLKSFPFVTDDNIEVAHSDVKLRISLGQAQQLLHAEYKRYRDDLSPGKPQVTRTLEYSLPKDIHQYVDMVGPTTMFGMRALSSTITRFEKSPEFFQAVSAGTGFNVTACNQTITPDCLAHVYGFEGYKAPQSKSSYGHRNKQSVLGVTGYLEQVAQKTDLQTFLTKYAPDQAGKTDFTITSVNGGNLTHNITDLGGYAEANLDVQYAYSIAGYGGASLKNEFYSTGGRPPFKPDLDVTDNNSEPYGDWLDWMLEQDELPDTVTTSYGESEQTVPLSYRLRVCDQLAVLAIRGVSLLFSSGDCGPGWSCKSNDGKNTTKFLPQFPATCPWVTAVGGTIYIEPENAVDFSAGGFSETWPMPLYQLNHIPSFFAKHPDVWTPFYNSKQKLFNRYGRGYPDIAAQGNNFHIILNGRDYKIGGTSASAPAAAGIIALLNNERRSKGRSPLGFLNPWLYSSRVSKSMTDVTHGTSVGCNGLRWGSPIAGDPHLVPNAGWKAVEGWDASTGLGTLNFDKLLKLI